MEEHGVERRLAAILVADVVGYSRLVGNDEAGTRARFNNLLREVVEPCISRRRGRMVKTMGDGLLVEFQSVVGAVQSAAEIQNAAVERAARESPGRRILLRIGINLGDVIIEHDDIHGEGVNMAARLEALAEPGGICISEDVYRQCRGKAGVEFRDLGEQKVKNIAEPVRAYASLPRGGMTPAASGDGSSPRRRVAAIAAAVVVVAASSGMVWWSRSTPDVEPASVGRMAYPLPDKPSIAVLPFSNISSDKQQEFFADGMTDDLITDLAKVSGLFVISRNSVFVYKGKPAKIGRVAEDLGVRYVLEGSVRRAGDRVRVNAQLTDATTGGHLWAERYDGTVTDIFALQDAITSKVVQALALHLTSGDKDRRDAAPRTDNPEVYELVLKARRLLTRFDYKAAHEARKLLERAIELDPHYARAHSMLGLYHFDAWRLWGENARQNLSRALELSRTSAKLNPLDPAPHVLSAQVHQFRRDFAAANADADAALKLQPNDAITLANLGSMLRYAHRPEEAAKSIERAIRLDPFHPPNYLEWLGDAYFLVGRYDRCIQAVERGMALKPDFVALHVVAAKCYAGRGLKEKGRAAAANILRLVPGFTIKAFSSYVPFTDEGDLQRNVDMLRKAGLPE